MLSTPAGMSSVVEKGREIVLIVLGGREDREAKMKGSLAGVVKMVKVA